SGRNDKFGAAPDADMFSTWEVAFVRDGRSKRNTMRATPKKTAQLKPRRLLYFLKFLCVLYFLSSHAAVESASDVPSNCARISRSVRISSSRDTWLFLNCRRKRKASFSGSYWKMKGCGFCGPSFSSERTLRASSRVKPDCKMRAKSSSILCSVGCRAICSNSDLVVTPFSTHFLRSDSGILRSDSVSDTDERAFPSFFASSSCE